MDFLPKPDMHEDLVSQVLKMQQQNAATQPGAEAIKAIGDVLGGYFQSKNNAVAQQRQFQQQKELAQVKGNEQYKNSHFEVSSPEMADKYKVPIGTLIPNAAYVQGMKPPSSTQLSSLTSEEQQSLDAAQKKHPEFWPPDILKGRGQGYLKQLAKQTMNNIDYNPASINTTYGAGKAGASGAARLQSSGSPQILARYAQSTRKIIDMTAKASDEFPRFGNQFMNTPYIKMKEQSSPEAIKFKSLMQDLRAHMASMYAKGGAQQREDKLAAEEAIPDSITPAQLKAMIPTWNQIIDAQVEGMMTPVDPSAVMNKNNQPIMAQTPAGRLTVQDKTGKVVGHIPNTPDQINLAKKQGYQVVQ